MSLQLKRKAVLRVGGGVENTTGGDVDQHAHRLAAAFSRFLSRGSSEERSSYLSDGIKEKSRNLKMAVS